MENEAKNPAEGIASETKAAVASANLISILDPKEMKDEEAVKVVSEVTGSSPEFVKDIAELVVESDKIEEPVAASENFSKKASEIIKTNIEKKNFSKTKNFAEEVSGEKAVADTAKVVSLIGADTLLEKAPEEIIETIAEATGYPEEVVTPIVGLAVKNFSKGAVKAPSRVLLKFSKTSSKANFDSSVASDVTTSVEPAPKVDPKEPATLVEPAPTTVPAEVKQEPEAGKSDPKPGDVASDTTKVEQALQVQNEIAIVEKATEVAEAVEPTKIGNFSKQGSEYSQLTEILGTKFIPNK